MSPGVKIPPCGAAPAWREGKCSIARYCAEFPYRQLQPETAKWTGSGALAQCDVPSLNRSLSRVVPGVIIVGDGCSGLKNMEPQISRNFGLRSVGVCFAYPSFDKPFLKVYADERGFVALNPSHLICSWDLALLFFLSFSYVVASATYRRVGFYGFGVIIIEDSQIAIVFQKQ